MGKRGSRPHGPSDTLRMVELKPYSEDMQVIEATVYCITIKQIVEVNAEFDVWPDRVG